LGGCRLAEGAMLSIVEDLENQRGGVAFFQGRHERGIAGTVGFAGGVAQNIQSNQWVEIGGKDVTDILSDCAEIYDTTYSSVCLDCDDGSCGAHVNRFQQSLYILSNEDYKPDQEEQATLDDHLLLINSLCTRSSKYITLKPSSSSDRNSDFKVFAKLADTARETLIKHWPVVVELAEWLDREKEISNEKVHGFLLQRLKQADAVIGKPPQEQTWK
jgi:hypothetical protein